MFLLEVVPGGHRDGQVTVFAVVGHLGEVRKDLPAGGARADAVRLGDLSGDVVAGLAGPARAAELRPVARRAVPRPAAFLSAASRRDTGGHVVPGVPPVAVVLCRSHAPEPAVGVREKAVRRRKLRSLVVFRHVVLDPVYQVVRCLVDIVAGPERRLGTGLFQHRVEEIEDALRLVALAGDDILGGQTVPPLRERLQVVYRTPEVAAVLLGERLQRRSLVVDLLLPAEITQHRQNRALRDRTKLDILAGVSQPFRHIVELVRNEHDRLSGVFHQVRRRPGTAAVHVAVDVVCLVHNEESPARPAGGQCPALCGLTRNLFDHVFRARVRGVELDCWPAPVGRQRVRRRGFPTPGGPCKTTAS